MTEMNPDAIKSALDAALREALPGALREGIRQAVRDEVHFQLEPIREKIGEANDEGTGGSGLTGEVARLNTKISQVLAYKNIGYGIFIALGITGGFLYLGFKSWLIGLFHPTTTP